MKFLIDTHLLLWAAAEPEKLPHKARLLMEDEENRLFFSAASIWEVTIKRSLGRKDFYADARLLRAGLLDNGYEELAITSEHAVFIDSLPALHKDPFDRILIAQATVESITLLTADSIIAQYPGSIMQV